MNNLKLFFDNGGSDCFIISIGQYGTNPSELEIKPDNFKKAIDYSRNVLLELMDSLNMKTEIGKNTYSLYRFADRRLIMASIRQNTERVDEAVSIMQRLRDAYAKSVENDDSPVLMQNAEVAYAGMTYGPGELNTDYSGAGANRGYLA